MPDLLQPIIKHTPFYAGQLGISGTDSPLGIRTVTDGRVFYVDSEAITRNDNNDGTDPMYPLATLLAAYNKTVSGRNDVVVLIGRSTAYALDAPLVWSNTYTHLTGVCADLNGLGQRCRVTGSDVLDLLNLVTFSGDGCVVTGIQFYNGADAAQDSGAVVVTGDRCRFENCFFNGINDAANVGSRADVYSLKLDASSECYFKDCTIGSDTLGRTSTNAELWLRNGSSKARFDHCLFLKYSTAVTNFMVRLDVSVSTGLNIFENCIFTNRGAATDCFNVIGAGAFDYRTILKSCTLQGFTGWSDVLDGIWSDSPAPVNTFGVSLNPAA